MLLIAAALAEELATGLELCVSRCRVRFAGGSYWSGIFSGHKITFFKTGVGPRKASNNLDKLIASIHPDRILVIGYAGGLAPDLKIGDLAVLQQTSIFGEKQEERRMLEQLEIANSYNLCGIPELLDLARSAELRTRYGHGLTSPFILGNPAQKRVLYKKFQALTVDMETSALARVASKAEIPLACVRAISDEAEDETFAPFSYNPDGSNFGLAMRVVGAGKWRHRLISWRLNAGKARESLRSFLRHCFETWSKGDSQSSWLT